MINMIPKLTTVKLLSYNRDYIVKKVSDDKLYIKVFGMQLWIHVDQIVSSTTQESI